MHVRIEWAYCSSISSLDKIRLSYENNLDHDNAIKIVGHLKNFCLIK